ncbi:hypothetical protein G6F66_014685 [Rhizopus arrhizus]|nr:hypothetical protein G6F66_014685 [Rhizopus arrhizus]
MAQPPLTAAIRRLEDELGSELIVRGNRTLGLTVAGQTLLVEARVTLQQAEQALQRTREAAAGQSGSLQVGYVGSALYGRLPGGDLTPAAAVAERAAHRRGGVASTDSCRRTTVARLRPRPSGDCAAACACIGRIARSERGDAGR